MWFDEFETPIGRLTTAVDEGALCHVLFEKGRYGAPGREDWKRDASPLRAGSVPGDERPGCGPGAPRDRSSGPWHAPGPSALSGSLPVGGEAGVGDLEHGLEEAPSASNHASTNRSGHERSAWSVPRVSRWASSRWSALCSWPRT